MFKHALFLCALTVSLAGLTGCHCFCNDSGCCLFHGEGDSGCCLFHNEDPMYHPGDCDNCYNNNCAQGCKFRQVCGQNPFNERFCECVENCCIMPWNWFRHCGDATSHIQHVDTGPVSDGGLGLGTPGMPGMPGNCASCNH